MRAKFVFGNILNELSENSTLYHRSMKKMEVGDVINPKLDKEGNHWLAKTPFEKALEFFRQKHFPDAPSRLTCIYSSVIPRSRFKDKGYLYTIKPTGKMLLTDSRMIDKMGDEYSREFYERADRWYGDYSKGKAEIEKDPKQLMDILNYMDAERYWNGKSWNMDKEGMEVLSEGAIVTEVLGVKENDLTQGENIKVTESGKLRVNTVIYFKDEEALENYKNGNIKMNKFIDSFKILYETPTERLTEYENASGGGNLTITGYIKKDAKLKILYFLSSMGKRKARDSDDYDSRSNYKYERIHFIPLSINKKMEGKFKMEYFYSYTPHIRDISKFMKKI